MHDCARLHNIQICGTCFRFAVTVYYCFFFLLSLKLNAQFSRNVSVEVTNWKSTENRQGPRGFEPFPVSVILMYRFTKIKRLIEKKKKPQIRHFRALVKFVVCCVVSLEVITLRLNNNCSAIEHHKPKKKEHNWICIIIAAAYCVRVDWKICEVIGQPSMNFLKGLIKLRHIQNCRETHCRSRSVIQNNNFQLDTRWWQLSIGSISYSICSINHNLNSACVCDATLAR